MMIDTEGKPFPEIMNETILGPLRMTASTYEQPLPASRQDEAAKGHLPNGKQVSGGNHVYPEMAAAGLWATAEDLAKFFIEIQLAMVGDGRTMMTPESTKAMLTPFVGKQNGLGLFLVEHGDDVYFQHGGWNEGFSSAATAHRDKGYGVVVLTNGNKPALIDEVIVSVARAYHWDNFATPEYTEQKLSKSEIANIEGRYNHAGNPVRVYLENEKMFIHPFGKSPQRLIHIGAQQFARRSETGLVCFSQDRATGMQQFAFLSPWESEPTDQESFIKLNDDEKLAADWILEGQFDKALQAFQALKENNPDDENIQEATLNNAGYALLGIGEKQMAIDTLRINTLLYPEAFNTYDSLGEAYLTNDQTELALVNYKKSVELNPNNTYAVQVIAKLSNKQ
jgi:hypothetical protein